MKRITLLSIAFCALGLSGYAQGNPQRGGDGAQVPVTAPRDTSVAHQSATPVMQAIEMNFAEVELGKIAAQKAQNKGVKDFADMMVKDHSATLMKLRPLQPANTSDVKMNAKHQETADRLSKLTGAEFDREYMKAMVAGHHDAVAFYEQQAAHSNAHGDAAAAKAPSAQNSPDLARIAQESLPTTRHHLQMAQQVQKSVQ